MQSILKKTLVAAAIASAASANAATISGAATALDVNGDSVVDSKDGASVISAEGLSTLTYVPVGGTGGITATVTVGADYQETDLLVLTVAGATITNKSASGITITANGGVANADGDSDTVVNDNVATAIGVDAAAGTITFRPESGTEFEAGEAYTVAGLTLADASGSITMASSGKTVQGIDFDSGAAKQIGQVASQFGATASTKLNREIDVENERKQFTTKNAGASEGTTKDSVAVALTTAASDVLTVSVATGATFALEGSDLDFLLDKDGKLASASYSFSGLTESTASGKATALDNATLTANATNAVSGTVSLELVADGKADANAQVLEAQSFSVDVSVPYSFDFDGVGTVHGSTTGSVAFNDIAAGAWSLSGATRNVYYMPYGSGISQIIYVSNDGKVDGDIEMTAFDDEGNEYGPIKLSVTAAPGAVTQLSLAIKNALTEAGFDGLGKVDFTIVVNSPDADIDLYAAYNVRGDRVTVPVE